MLASQPEVSDLNFTVDRPPQVEAYGELKPVVLDPPIEKLTPFQIETIVEFNPHVAVITNITPDHLDRHPDFEAREQGVAVRDPGPGLAAPLLAADIHLPSDSPDRLVGP